MFWLNLLIFIILASSSYGQEWVNYQFTQPRVIVANQNKYTTVESWFNEKGLSFPTNRIFWRAFKWNKVLELWAFSEDSARYIMVKSLPICEVIGDLGPKRKEGDLQIPEGFYYLENFNPYSKYHLSIKISYPNKSDSIFGSPGQLGGDIYIHGGCETIGCIPITDTLMEAVYLINLYARSLGQKLIPFHIFPTKLSMTNYNKMKREYFNGRVELLDFWANLKEGYDFFEKRKYPPQVEINDFGKYIFF